MTVTNAQRRTPNAERAAVFAAEMCRWLERRLDRPGLVVEPDTPLFAGGLIDSLRILELIAWTERETGRRIPDRMIRMDHFRTIATIARTFAGAAGAETNDANAR